MTFTPVRRSGPEMLDLPPEAYTRAELEGSLRDITRVNRYLGDYRAVVKHMARLAREDVGGRVSVLDVGSGSADIPLVLSRWAADAGLAMEFTALDSNEETLEIARSRFANQEEMEFVAGDGLSLPFRDDSYDIVLCCKTLHHFTEDDAVRFMGEALRVARRGILILDLRRSWIAWSLIMMLTRLFTRNRLTRNDGPLSVLRAFTPDEFVSLAARAGILSFTVELEPFWLMVGTGEIQ